MPKRRESQPPLSHGPSGAEWESAHERLKEDPEVWSRLQFQGVTGVRGAVYEMRGCPSCGSTINRPVCLSDAVAVLADYCGVVHRSLSMIPTLLPTS